MKKSISEIKGLALSAKQMKELKGGAAPGGGGDTNKYYCCKSEGVSCSPAGTNCMNTNYCGTLNCYSCPSC